MFFSVIAENLNWDILTKNLVKFLKDDMQLRMKNFKFKWTWWWIPDKSKLDKEKIDEVEEDDDETIAMLTEHQRLKNKIKEQ